MKIMTICTIDVHARDVVAKMIVAKARVPRPRDLGKGKGTLGSGQCVQGLQTLRLPLAGALTLLLAAAAS